MNPQTNPDREVIVGQYKIKVIRHLCISAAACVAISPNVFTLDDQKKAVANPVATDTDANILLAAQACPTQAIVITDKDTNQQLWPL